MNGRITRQTATAGTMSLPRVGSLKIGFKEQKNGKEYPKSVDYFIPSGKYAALFTQAYGDRPQSIQIVFCSNDPAKVCNERYEYRDDAGKLVAYGDGETFQVWDGEKYREYSVSQYPDLMAGVAKKHPNKAVRSGHDGWRITLTITFVIPMVQGVAGVWQFVTKGTASTIPNIRDTFDSMLAQHGYVSGIIFDLNVQFATSNKPNDKSRYPVVSLVPNESAENVAKIKQAVSFAPKLLTHEK